MLRRKLGFFFARSLLMCTHMSVESKRKIRNWSNLSYDKESAPRRVIMRMSLIKFFDQKIRFRGAKIKAKVKWEHERRSFID